MGNENPMLTPWEAFLIWFDRVPLTLRKYLAHIFRVCTTDDTAQMATLPDQSLEGFRNWVIKTDFPLRIAARMFYVRSIFDMVIFHYTELLEGDTYLPLPLAENNMVQLSSKQWEGVFDSWKTLRNMEFSDIYIHSWASMMIKIQMETK